MLKRTERIPAMSKLKELVMAFIPDMTTLHKQILIGLFIVIVLSPHHYSAEEECLKSKVLCYECESLKDKACNDPFNTSLDALKLCHGCCVKVVRERNTPTQNIWRTCTSRLQINLFMVDHVCMEESGGQGHMCFCESDGCNSVHSSHHGTFPRLSSVIAGLLQTPYQTIPWLLAQPLHMLSFLFVVLLLLSLSL